MEVSRWILILTAFSAVITVSNATTWPSWDIPFQLNRNFGLTAMNSDLSFPMDITTPADGLLYSVPAQTLFSDKQFPKEPLYMQLNFQPNASISEFYFLTIRDPDGVLRFSLSMYKQREMYRVQLRYNPLDSNDGERLIDFPFPPSPTYWRLGVWIKEDSVDFFTNCPRIQSAPFHEELGVKLLGRPLFREGASAFLLNSGLRPNPMYFQGVLTEFTLHSGPDALLAPCKTTEFREESGEPMYTFDPDFGNVIVTISDDDASFATTSAVSSPIDEAESAVASTPFSPAPPMITEIFTPTAEKADFGHFIPLLDLMDMSVRVLDSKKGSIIPNARIESGYLQFENGTSIRIRDVPGFLHLVEAASNVGISVDLLSGTTSLVDLETGDEIISRRSTEGIPLETLQHYSEGTMFEILLDNAIIQVDTYNGHWTVQNATTGEIELVQEVKDGVLYLANGEQLKMPTTGSQNEIIAIDTVTGVVRTLNKVSGEIGTNFQPSDWSATPSEEVTTTESKDQLGLSTESEEDSPSSVKKDDPWSTEEISSTAKFDDDDFIQSAADMDLSSKDGIPSTVIMNNEEVTQTPVDQGHPSTDVEGSEDIGYFPSVTLVDDIQDQRSTASLDDASSSGVEEEDGTLPFEGEKLTSSSSIDGKEGASTVLEKATTTSQNLDENTAEAEFSSPSHEGNASLIPKTDLKVNAIIPATTESSFNIEESKEVISIAPLDEKIGNYELSNNPVEPAVMVTEEKLLTPEVVDFESNPTITTSSASVSNKYLEYPDSDYPEQDLTVPSKDGNGNALESEGLLETETSSKPTTESLVKKPEDNTEIPPDSVDKSGEERPHRSVTTSSEMEMASSEVSARWQSPTIDTETAESAENQAQEILRSDCDCLERLLTPELVEKLRERDFAASNPSDEVYDKLFKMPSFLRVVREVIDEYFERPGVVERYKPNCKCPVNNGCECPESETTPRPPYNVSSSSQHILGALKDMSNGAIIMSNKSSLAKVAYSLAPGSMVYVSSEDTFYLKIDERENIWRTIDMNTQSQSVQLPEPEPTTTTTDVPPLDKSLIGKSLMLIAHNEPLNGELRFGARFSGGHSSAIFACQRAARRHNISHVFYPLISTDIFNMDYVVPPMYRYEMPIINVLGSVVFDDFMHLIKGEQSPKAPILTFAGKAIESNPLVPCAWIGAKPIYLNGDYEFAARSKCRNWQTRDSIETGLAVHIPMIDNATGFLDQSNLYEESCAKQCNLLCIQISPN